MKVLSLHLGHNATVALAEEGKIVGVLSQEKCDNVKNSAEFPAQAITALLRQVGWGKNEIDKILIASNVVYPPGCYEYLYDNKNRIIDKSRVVRILKSIRRSWFGRVFPWPFEILKNYRQEQLRRQGFIYLRNNLDGIGLGEKPIDFVEHHLCHARSAYHSLNLNRDKHEPALIFTLDGSGDGLCATVHMVDKNGNLNRIAETPAYSSIGGIYSNTTRFLGMKILEHEYKVMGLAPYAKEQYMLDTYERIFKPVIRLKPDEPLVFESKIDASTFYDYLAEHAVGERFDNMAAALQYLTEELVVQWISNAIQVTGIRKIFTGGGVFMNVKLNRRIQEMPDVKQAFFMPSCGDESNAIGAAYHHAVMAGHETEPLENLYLGIGYSSDAIESFIEQNDIAKKYIVERYDDIEMQVAKLLAKREIVARFAGRCEWGARSLGNRAILAHPSHMESFYTVNDYIKSRDFWMPFAPSILDSAATKYLKDYNPEKVKAPHMITAFAATDLGVQHLRAALHQGDHTLRPQVVEKKTNPEYYRLIQLFEEITGVGAILNTSFNLHGYPLVATPEQAIFTFENSGLQNLAIGSFLIRKDVI